MAALPRWGRAALDGPAALVAHGMTGFTPQSIDVSVAADSRPGRRSTPGVVVHRPLERGSVVTTSSGLPAVAPEVAALRAAQWAVSDKQAALLLCLSTQQRIADAQRIRALWADVQRSPRRGLLGAVITAISDGVQSLNELDFAQECRRRRLPEPTRQSIRRRLRTTCSGRTMS
ncbi:hypothetical protein [Demetria terragena]|uniref:hypothetical protein n=1 Tax=Demetria terragena TaxID=63959 RepID=UPI0012EA645E|nr:hypothetical protein [Demetria terragena]